MFILNIEVCKSLKQHKKWWYLNSCYNDEDIENLIEQESHFKIRLTQKQASTKLFNFVNSKLKTKKCKSLFWFTNIDNLQSQK